LNDFTRFRVSKTHKLKHCTLSAEKLIHRFLQHVLPRGFVKIRYFGFFGAALRPRLLFPAPATRYPPIFEPFRAK